MWRTGVRALYICAFALILVDSDQSHHDYCVIGAGPAGLQLGYFLKRSNRNYVVFEKSDRVGSFFATYPRHRKLISINKRFTGRLNKEFNFRHDWNSLISDDDQLLFTKYSENYFPSADKILEYFGDFHKKLDINVKFNAEISNISKSGSESCKYTMNDQHGNNYCCRLNVIIATGIATPKKSYGVGHEIVEGYESMSVNPKDYDGQSVLLFGRGNSAMETAISLYGHTAHLTLAARSRVAFSWDTHYVGDIRGVNNEVFDSYQLKSLDGVIDEMDLEQISFHRRPDGKIDLDFSATSPINLAQMDNSPARHGFDRVLRCTGFVWDLSPFSEDSKPAMLPKNKKYPRIDFDYQSVNQPGMYFAGTLAHSLDWRKSAGGFIHGFRYTAQALHRLLEWKNHKVKWPTMVKPVDQMANTFLRRANEASGIYQMFSHFGDFAIYDRASRMFTYLGDFPVHLLDRLYDSTGVRFMERSHLLFTLTMEYGANFSKAGADHFGTHRAVPSLDMSEKSNFLHPVLRVFSSIPEKSKLQGTEPSTIFNTKPLGLLHLLEDFTTEFTAVRTHIAPLKKFIEFFTELDLRPHAPDFCALEMITANVYRGGSLDKASYPYSCHQFAEAEEHISIFSE